MKDMKVKEKILNAAQERMLKHGYRKVTVDEIAADLVMSKNTIYKHFQSKEDIANHLIYRLKDRLNVSLGHIESSEEDPLKAFSDSIIVLRREIGPWFMYFFKDTPNELPELWNEFLRYRNEKILDIRKIIERGVKKKVFRKVHQSIAVQAYLGSIKAILNPKFLEDAKITFDDALEEIIDIWSNGIIKKKVK